MPTETHTESFAARPPEEIDGSAAGAFAPEDSVDLLDVALVLAARKRFILLCGLIAAVVTALVVWFMPQTFTATATMMPPQRQSSASQLLGQLGGLASLVGGGGGGAASALGLKNPDDLYIGLLQSETIADHLIDRFHLMHVYRAKKLSSARKALASHTKVIAEKSSLISISVSDHDSSRAAAMANDYMTQLHQLMSHLAITEASQRRLFFEQQLGLEKVQLAKAEAALVATEQKTGIIQPQGQAQAVIATIMQLQAQISARQVELGALQTSATAENPQVITLKSQIAGLHNQLADFEKGHPGAVAMAGNVLTPTSKVPTASLEYLRRLRDVKFHETLYEIMARQYEMARVDEAKQAQAIQVVDPALVPDRRSWPPRTLLTLAAFLGALLLAALWAIAQAAWRNRMSDPELAAKVHRLRQTL